MANLLCVTLFHNSQNIYPLEFLKKEREQTIVVTPDPFTADTFREKIQKVSGNNPLSVHQNDVITLSKFISDWLGQYNKEEDFKIWKKSEVLQYLAIAWKRYNSSLPDAAFFQAFKQITDLRAYTLDIELVREVVDEYGAEMAQMIEKLWPLYQAMGIQDEQQAYLDLAECLKLNVDAPYQQKNIVFWGFRFLNGHQLDLLKSLSIRNDVYVPIPQEVFDMAISSDWVKWLGENIETIDSLEQDLESKILTTRKIEAYQFPKNRLSESIGPLLDLYKSKGPQKFECDLFLTANRPELDLIEEVSLEGLHFKTNTSLLAPYLNQLFKKLSEDYIEQEVESVNFFI